MSGASVAGAPSVVVIGSGAGGLAAAVALAARGARVTLVEREEALGGKLRPGRVGGRAMDVGPTVLTMRWVLDELFAEAGRRVDDYVTLRPAEVLARHAWADGARLDLYADLDRTADAIGALAGAGEAKGYRAFCAYARAIYEAVERPFLRAQRPTLAGVLASEGLGGLWALTRIDGARVLWRALGDHFRDARLRQLFARYATYCGSSPFLAPATLNVVAHVERAGVWLPAGGLGAVAAALATLAGELGVEARCGAGVAEVLVRGGRAAGVRLDSGDEVAADAVVWNGDSAALAAGLAGEGARAAWPHDPRAGPGRSLSALTFALVAETAGFPLVRHNVFFSRDCAGEFRDLFARAALPAEPTAYVCAQDRGDEPAAGLGAERLLVIVNAPARGPARPYGAEEVRACEQRTRALLAARGLTVSWEPARARVTTPDDFARRFPGTDGALYGPASHGWRAALARAPARTKVPGLYLAGGSGHPGAGVPMAALSGRLAAASVCADLASTRRSRPAATAGGTSTR